MIKLLTYRSRYIYEMLKVIGCGPDRLSIEDMGAAFEILSGGFDQMQIMDIAVVKVQCEANTLVELDELHESAWATFIGTFMNSPAEQPSNETMEHATEKVKKLKADVEKVPG